MLTIAVKAGNDKVGKPANQIRSQDLWSPLPGACLSLTKLHCICQATWTMSVFGALDPSLPPKSLSVSDVGVKLPGPCPSLSSVLLSGFRVGFRFQDSFLCLGSLSQWQSHKVEYD